MAGERRPLVGRASRPASHAGAAAAEIVGSEIRIDAPLPDNALGREVAAEIRSGRKRGLSVEFHATEERRVQGVREVLGALVDAAAVVESPAYDQARVELRARKGRRWWR